MQHTPHAAATHTHHGGFFGKAALRALAFLCLFCFISTVHAARITDRSKQKKRAEAQQADLGKKLDKLKKEISKTESAKDSAADTLAASEAAISDANRSLRELASEQQDTQTKLSKLSDEEKRLDKTMREQQTRLATVLREQFVTGNENRVKLLMSGDNPNRINRELQYMSFVSQAQSRLIAQLQATLKAVEANREATENAKAELDEIAQDKRSEKGKLEKEKSRRAADLNKIAAKLKTQRMEAARIKRNQERLSALVDKLAKLVEEQRKAAALKRQKTKKITRSRKGTKSAPESTLVNEEEPSAADASGASFARQRGKLKLPVRGTITAKFGSKREDGPVWKGLFIRTNEGAEIKAIAAGKVVFADWLRGFGNLIIVDHGSQYMTIYGNNQTLFKRAGQSVSAGDVIAGAGNSGGNEHSGLYFEIRHRGRAFDPLGWVTLR